MTIQDISLSLVVALAIGLCVLPAGAYPGYWANIAKTNCTRVPASPKELSSSPHSSPQINSGLKFELRAASTGSLVNSLCPGGSYKLKLLFPVSGAHYLLVSTHGNFSDSSLCGKVDGCPNRACNCSANRSDSGGSLSQLCPVLAGKEVEHDLMMPADDTLRGTTNVFQALFITNAIGGFGALQTNTASLDFTCLPRLVNAVNATRLRVNQTSVLRMRAFDIAPPPARPVDPADIKRVTVTSKPAGVVTCMPARPRVTANNVATTICKAQKVGVATVTAAYAGAITTRVLQVVG